MRGVFYLDSNNLHYFGGTAAAPLVLAFQPTAIHDMEVVDMDEVEKQLTEFITANKLQAAETVMILAPTIYFVKELTPEKKPEEQQAEKNVFLENVPVSELTSREYPNTKKTTIVATNQELYLTIVLLLQKHQFIVTAVVPSFIIGGNAAGFSNELAQQALKQFASLKQASFALKDESPDEIRPEEKMFEVQEKNNNRLFIMLGLFGILIGILIIVLMLQQQSKNNKANAPTPTLIPLRAANDAPSPTVSTAPSIDPATREALRIQIFNGSGIAGQADEVAAILEEIGYTEIETGNASDVGTANTTIIFKPSVTTLLREEIVASLETTLGEISTRESAEIGVDISITTAPTTTP